MRPCQFHHFSRRVGSRETAICNHGYISSTAALLQRSASPARLARPRLVPESRPNNRLTGRSPASRALDAGGTGRLRNETTARDIVAGLGQRVEPPTQKDADKEKCKPTSIRIEGQSCRRLWVHRSAAATPFDFALSWASSAALMPCTNSRVDPLPQKCRKKKLGSSPIMWLCKATM